ncbi:hypothetical protein [Adhaeribacter radiodurans]|uniref:Uncharacterized protein n=1 Tax=Adhaeribacter radiodurans TaxID=2745197 RepID=A0A7L7L5N6_9BACT|nr:hypothetical protein [Adhaeribacter radiodurans]QMU28083.1 hypothetical protein HUW48_08495 [Adhaeribacter radiodurans]
MYLTINNRAKAALFASLGQLRKVPRIVSGNLNLLEKQQLLGIFKKLKAFIISSSYSISIRLWMSYDFEYI